MKEVFSYIGFSIVVLVGAVLIYFINKKKKYTKEDPSKDFEILE